MVEINHFDDVPKAVSIKATSIGYHQLIFFSLLDLPKNLLSVLKFAKEKQINL